MVTASEEAYAGRLRGRVLITLVRAEARRAPSRVLDALHRAERGLERRRPDEGPTWSALAIYHLWRATVASDDDDPPGLDAIFAAAAAIAGAGPLPA
jgi:hypothetical protein